MSEIIGLLHPLVVHLPIGFILLAIGVEWFIKKKGFDQNELPAFLWFLSALASIVAVITGLLLVDSGHYEGFHVFLHRWTAISIAVLASIIFWLKWRRISLFPNQGILLKSAVLILLVVAGHKGGEITHGTDYFPFMKTEGLKNHDLSITQLDSISLYRDIVHPIFENKCIRCHEEGDARGRLNLQTQIGMLNDVFGDPGIMPGNISQSEVFKRITISSNHKKFMPPSGIPMTYSEIRILEYWINSGASFTDVLTEYKEIPHDVKALLGKSYGIDFTEKSLYEILVVAPADSASIEKVRSNEFNVRKIAANSNLLDVNRMGKSKEVTSDQLENLQAIKEQITWLDLSDTDIDNSVGDVLGSCIHLTKLKLHNTEVDDELIPKIAGLKYLEVINLYNTNLTDEGLKMLMQIPTLKSIFIWQTKVTMEGIEASKSTRPTVNIVGSQDISTPAN